MVASKEPRWQLQNPAGFQPAEVTLRCGWARRPWLPPKIHAKAQLTSSMRVQGDQELLNGKAQRSSPRHHAGFPGFEVPGQTVSAFKRDLYKRTYRICPEEGDVDTLKLLQHWITIRQTDGWLAERKHYWFETTEWETLVK